MIMSALPAQEKSRFRALPALIITIYTSLWLFYPNNITTNSDCITLCINSVITYYYPMIDRNISCWAVVLGGPSLQSGLVHGTKSLHKLDSRITGHRQCVPLMSVKATTVK